MLCQPPLMRSTVAAGASTFQRIDSDLVGRGVEGSRISLTNLLNSSARPLNGLQRLRSPMETTHIHKGSTMMKRTLRVSTLAAALSLSAGLALAADPEPAKEKAQTPKQEQIYGSQLMTQQERIEHRAKMRAAKTAEEREQIRKEHHELMKERAKARGVTLPDEPPARGGGMMGPGGGMGPGSGGMKPGGGS